MFQKKLKEDDVSVTCTERSVTANVKLPSGDVFSKTWALFAAVDADNMKVDVTPYKVDIELMVRCSPSPTYNATQSYPPPPHHHHVIHPLSSPHRVHLTVVFPFPNLRK